MWCVVSCMCGEVWCGVMRCDIALMWCGVVVLYDLVLCGI